MLRELQLRNVYSMEHIDEQVDSIISLKVAIDDLKGDLLTTRQR